MIPFSMASTVTGDVYLDCRFGCLSQLQKDIDQILKNSIYNYIAILSLNIVILQASKSLFSACLSFGSAFVALA